jgi:hypothetical protein
MFQMRQGSVCLGLILLLSACGGNGSNRSPVAPVAPTNLVTPPPSAPDVYTVTPSAVSTGHLVSLTINGAAFDPATAQVVVTGPGCFGDTACVVPNGGLSTKTGAQLVAPVVFPAEGGFTIRVRHGSDGPISNGRPVTVVDPPTLLVDGAGASTRPRGQTFVFSGTKYAPGGMVIRSVSPPIGGSPILLPMLDADASGNVTWSFTPTCSDPVGTWKIWLIDDDSGRESNSVTYSVTAGAGC